MTQETGFDPAIAAAMAEQDRQRAARRSALILQDGIEQSRRAAADDPPNAKSHEANADLLGEQMAEIVKDDQL